MWSSASYERNSLKNVLLGVVSGVSKDPRVDTTFDTIPAFDHDPVLHRVDKGVIEQMLPNRVHQFSVAVSQDILLLGLPVFMYRCGPVIKCVGKLRFSLTHMVIVE